jgi:alpha-tubulin suppressor-like RCC1 family protein
MITRPSAGVLARVAVLLAALCAGGCAFASVRVDVDAPIGGIDIPQGDSASVFVTATSRGCQVPPPECIDVADRLIEVEYEVLGLPEGVTVSIDESLRSSSTPSVVKLTFRAAVDAPPGRRLVSIIPVLAGVVLDQLGALLTVRVLEDPRLSGSPAPTAAVLGVAASDEHSLAVLADGTVWGWGRNTSQQLGFYEPWEQTAPSPVRVPGVAGATMVAAGDGFSLALLTDGTVWNWGEVPSVFSETRAAPVNGLRDVRQVAAGPWHALALLRDGTVRAWGWGYLGVLGDGTFEDRSEPVEVVGLTAVRGVAAGGHYSLALTSDGHVWVWGNAGLRDDSADSRTPVPVTIAGLAGVRAIAVGREHALALRIDGTVWAWGSNRAGQLGDGTQTDHDEPVRVLGLDGVQAIAAGEDLSLALRADGTVWAWGAAAIERDGGPAGSSTPVPVPGLKEIRAIAAGGLHMLALSSCGQVWTRGRNDLGQLGDGTYMPRWAESIPLPGIGSQAGCSQVVLDVGAAGDGDGRIESADGRVSCVGVGCVDFVVVDRGTTMTLDAVPAADTIFRRWAGDCQGFDTRTTVTMDQSRRCAALFDRTDSEFFLLSVVAEHGRVTSSGGGFFGVDHIDCGPICSAIFQQNTTVTLAARPDAGFAFVEWGGACTGTSLDTSVLLDRRRSCTAQFRPFELTVEITGEGRVTSEPPGIDCGAPRCTYAPGETTTLSAVPAVGWQFNGWGGDCLGGTHDAIVTMDADKTCTASFGRITRVAVLTVVVEGDGTVTSEPAGISCAPTCIAAFDAGLTVTLTAHPTPASLVSGWFDDCAAPGTSTNQIVMDADKTCRIRFTPRSGFPVAEFTYFPTPRVGRIVRFDGSGSHVLDPVTGTRDPAGIRSFSWDFDDDGVFEASGGRAAAAVAQHAFQTPGPHPVRLRVVGGEFDDVVDVIEEIAVLDAAGTLFGLSVEKAGGGDGTIATDPPGLIACGPGCDMTGPVLLDEGTQVILTASAAPGATFTGWGGDCAGVSPSIEVTLDRARHCTATFAPALVSLTVAVVKPAGSVGRIIAVSPPGNPISCDGTGPVCVASFAPGTSVTVRPSDTSIELNLFGSWAGCDGVGGLFACTVTLTADRTVTASFVR